MYLQNNVIILSNIKMVQNYLREQNIFHTLTFESRPLENMKMHPPRCTICIPVIPNKHQ